jgi:hypothetical protein
MSNPGIDHWQAIKRLLCYIKGTLDYSITYYSSSHPKSTLQPCVYSDASHADCIDTARSTHRYVVTMAGRPVSWSSHCQSVVTLSTTESEYIAAVHAAQTAMWMEKFMNDVYLPISKPVIIHMDSSGGESLAKRSANYTKVRHLHVRYHWLRNTVRCKEIDISHIPSSENPADIFTKPLPAPLLLKHLRFLGITV